MSPRRTRRGIVRESVSEISADTSLLKSASKTIRSTRRTNRNQTAKGSEEENDSHVEMNSIVDNMTANSFLNESSINTRKRRRKAQESTLSQDISLSVTIEESKANLSTKKSNLKTPKSKKQTKSSKLETTDGGNSLISEDESFNVKNQKGGKRVSYSIENLLSEDDEEVPQASSRKRTKSDNQNVSLHKKRCKTPEKSSKKTSSNVKSSEGNVTPKSSPLNVPSTPHRTTKTPIKSPINLGSPKTHSRNSLKLLNVPRKLSIIDSPPSSEKSNNSLQQQDSSNIVSESIKNTSLTKKDSKVTKKKSHSPTLKVRPRFSKSPKIVFKTPKSKTKSGKKSPTKSPNVSPKKSKKSLNIDTSLTESKKVTETVASRKSQESSTIDSPLKSEKIPKSVVPGKTTKSKSPKKSPKSVNKTQETDSPVKSVKSQKSSPVKSVKSPKSISPAKPVEPIKLTSPVMSTKSPKIASPIKSTKSPKVTLSVESQQSDMNVSLKSKRSLDASLKSTKSPLNTSLKSKKSPKVISPSKSRKSAVGLPLSSKKMPKIFLSLKSKKSPLKSSRVSSPSKLKKSPLKSSKVMSPSKLKKSPLKTSKVTSPSKLKKSPKVVSSPIKSSRKSAVNNVSGNSSLSPRVLINKLSTPQFKNSTLNVTENQPTINLVPVDHKDQQPVTPNYHKTSVRGGKSPKSPKSLAKRSAIKSSTPAKAARTPMSIARKTITGNVSLKKTPSDVLDRKLLNLKPANTSTPRDRNIKRTLTSASNKKVESPKQSTVVLNGSPISKSKVIKRLNSQSIKTDHPLLEDESEPSLNESSLIHMSDVFDSDNSQNNDSFKISKSSSNISSKRKSLNNSNISQKTNRSNTFEIKKTSLSLSTKEKKDNTYEVEHPKTPGFQKKSNKRTLDETELETTAEQESKKTCKVHFASPQRGNQVRSSGINRTGTPGHAIQQKRTPISISKIKTPVTKAETQKRLSSVSGSQVKTVASTPINKRRSNVLSDTTLKSGKSNHKSQVASVNRLSRPRGTTDSEKKLGKKTPIASKIPNFAEIHQKRFAKMESLIDLKKRVEKRHEVLNTATPSTKKKNPLEHASSKPAPPDSTNGAYSRFGFKLRKNDAVNIISKKQTGGVDSREKKREDARSALKGVRMNRRFELQMKSRIKNT